MSSDYMYLLEEINDFINQINDHTNDPETRHKWQDQLYTDFIIGVSLNKYSPIETNILSKELSKIVNMDFTRWYA